MSSCPEDEALAPGRSASPFAQERIRRHRNEQLIVGVVFGLERHQPLVLLFAVGVGDSASGGEVQVRPAGAETAAWPRRTNGSPRSALLTLVGTIGPSIAFALLSAVSE